MRPTDEIPVRELFKVQSAPNALWIPFLTILLWPLLAFPCTANAQTANAGDPNPSFTSNADLGFGFVDEDGFGLLLLGQGFYWDGLEILVEGPLRFRAIDRAPEDKGVLRKQDWDEPSDYARIIPLIRYEHSWNDSYINVRLGELNNVSLGHGSLVDSYFNSIDMDRYQGGALLKGQWEGNGAEFMMENVVTPEILAGRVFIAPLSWFLEGDWPRRVELGYTLGADIAAPLRLQGNGNTTIVATGGDLSVRAIRLPWLELMPYVNLMAMDGDLGVHGGLAADFTISEPDNLFLNVRGEYRYVGPDYHPAVFNPFYDYNRHFLPIDTQGGYPDLRRSSIRHGRSPSETRVYVRNRYSDGRNTQKSARDTIQRGRPSPLDHVSRRTIAC